MTDILYGLPPLACPGVQVLICGNMPSAMSLAAAEYYGNPRNAFWRIVGTVFGFDWCAPYPARAGQLTGHGVAVWDVLRSCRREGSLDSAVQRDSMVPNDFAAFFAAHSSIRRLLFNGAAAESNYRRLVRDAPEIPGARLPSTSPAQTMRFADKLAAWQDALSHP